MPLFFKKIDTIIIYIASIKKYGGFYIGRYELSKEGVQKNQPTLTNTNWYNLYKNRYEKRSVSYAPFSVHISESR